MPDVCHSSIYDFARLSIWLRLYLWIVGHLRPGKPNNKMQDVAINSMPNAGGFWWRISRCTSLTAGERSSPRASAVVGWVRLAKIATVAKADTIHQWLRLMLKRKLGIQKVGPGEPPTCDEVQQVIIRMAIVNAA